MLQQCTSAPPSTLKQNSTPDAGSLRYGRDPGAHLSFPRDPCYPSLSLFQVNSKLLRGLHIPGIYIRCFILTSATVVSSQQLLPAS